MPLQYFKPDILVSTCCEHCGTQRKETLARLYADEPLVCAACGQEHTIERSAFRHNLEETEAAVAAMPRWTATVVNWLRLP